MENEVEKTKSQNWVTHYPDVIFVFLFLIVLTEPAMRAIAMSTSKSDSIISVNAAMHVDYE